MNKDEEQALSLLKAYYKAGEEAEQANSTWWPPTILKTLSLKSFAFLAPEESEDLVSLNLSAEKTLYLWGQYPNSLLENPSQDFLKALTDFLKTTF